MVNDPWAVSEHNLVAFWRRSGLSERSIEQHRDRIPRYLMWLRAQGLTFIPARRARDSREAYAFAFADNILSLQILQLAKGRERERSAHHLRNFLGIRPWKP